MVPCAYLCATACYRVEAGQEDERLAVVAVSATVPALHIQLGQAEAWRMNGTLPSGGALLQLLVAP
jgi:hypothetical protein